MGDGTRVTTGFRFSSRHRALAFLVLTAAFYALMVAFGVALLTRQLVLAVVFVVVMGVDGAARQVLFSNAAQAGGTESTTFNGVLTPAGRASWRAARDRLRRS